MKQIISREILPDKSLKNNSKGSVVTIGNFDGFHQGHQKIIKTLIKTAKEKNLVSKILTFHPNTKLFFDKQIQLINTEDQKEENLKETAVDNIIYLDFKVVSAMEVEEFLKDILIDRLFMKFLVVGHDFRFGKGKTGNINILDSLRRGLEYNLVKVAPVMVGLKEVSSSNIRALLKKGMVEEAASLKGSSYIIDGFVKRGEGRGRKLGFPTINLETANLITFSGVFKTRTYIGSEIFNSITNIGTRPTFNCQNRAIETYIPGFNKEIYNEKVKISFEKKIRDEIKFDSEEGLVRCIKDDLRQIC